MVSSSHTRGFLSPSLSLAPRMRGKIVCFGSIAHCTVAIFYHYFIVSKPKIMNVSLGLWLFSPLFFWQKDAWQFYHLSSYPANIFILSAENLAYSDKWVRDIK